MPVSFYDIMDYSIILILLKAVLIRLIHQRNLSPEAVMYVGDEMRDITAAHQSGVKVTAVSWGFNSLMALAKCQPHALISHPYQLPVVIKQQLSLIGAF